MAIRKRITTVEVDPADNVITENERANDSRGVFNPKDNPLVGSIMEPLGDTPDTRASLIRHFAHEAAEDGTLPAPDQIRTQDLLAIVRTNRNACHIEQRYRDRIGSTLSAIRAFCVVECRAASVKAVTDCTCISCPLWALRMGTNGLRS